jgi:hypothetical protein
VLAALNNNDVNAFQQNLNSLISFSEEGIKKLNNTKGFHGDAELIKNARIALNFYIQEANTSFKTYSDFFIAKDNFYKTKKRFDAIKKNKRTQKDIDQYNNAINTFNSSVEEVNKESEQANKKRGKALDAFNNSVEEFFKGHS